MSCSPVIQKTDEAKVENHPCYNEEAHGIFARMHIPVAPACNIQCNYCNRKFDCSNESRPGVTSSKLKPLDAVKKVMYVGSELKNLTVVGIAGPGDALANQKATFETLELLKEHTKDITLCISTNGLELEESADRLKELGVEHITVTINTLNPQTGAKIYPWIYVREKKKKLRGVEGAEFLLTKQLRGIRKAIDAGMLIKANSVLIPGINDKDLPELSNYLKKEGVFLHNIMPLLSKPEFGTHFGLNGVRSATNKELQAAQEACGVDMKLMKHCKQCRSDAIGILGKDVSSEFEKNYREMDLDTLKELYDVNSRSEFQINLGKFKAAAKSAEQDSNMVPAYIKAKAVVVTSTNKESIDMHFGSATEFLLYRVDKNGVEFLRKLVTPQSYCSGEENCGQGNPMEPIKEILSGVDMLFTAKIGPSPRKELEEFGVTVNESFENMPIVASLKKELLA